MSEQLVGHDDGVTDSGVRRVRCSRSQPVSLSPAWRAPYRYQVLVWDRKAMRGLGLARSPVGLIMSTADADAIARLGGAI